MFGLFKKKTEKQKLEDEFQNLLEEAYVLSKTNRRKSDEKTAEANEILKKIEALKE